MDEGIERRKRSLNETGETGEENHSKKKSAKRRLRLTPQEKELIKERRAAKRKDAKKTPGKPEMEKNLKEARGRQSEEEEDDGVDVVDTDESHDSEYEETSSDDDDGANSVIRGETPDEARGAAATAANNAEPHGSWAKEVEDAEAMDIGEAAKKKKETARKSSSRTTAVAPSTASAPPGIPAAAASASTAATAGAMGGAGIGASTAAKKRIVIKVTGAYGDEEFAGMIYAEKEARMREMMPEGLTQPPEFDVNREGEIVMAVHDNKDANILREGKWIPQTKDWRVEVESRLGGGAPTGSGGGGGRGGGGERKPTGPTIIFDGYPLRKLGMGRQAGNPFQAGSALEKGLQEDLVKECGEKAVRIEVMAPRGEVENPDRARDNLKLRVYFERGEAVKKLLKKGYFPHDKFNVSMATSPDIQCDPECNRCLSLEHQGTARGCRQDFRCRRCSGVGHNRGNCANEPHCINCEEAEMQADHGPTEGRCPLYAAAKRAMRMKMLEERDDQIVKNGELDARAKAQAERRVRVGQEKAANRQAPVENPPTRDEGDAEARRVWASTTASTTASRRLFPPNSRRNDGDNRQDVREGVGGFTERTGNDGTALGTRMAKNKGIESIEEERLRSQIDFQNKVVRLLTDLTKGTRFNTRQETGASEPTEEEENAETTAAMERLERKRNEMREEREQWEREAEEREKRWKEEKERFEQDMKTRQEELESYYTTKEGWLKQKEQEMQEKMNEMQEKMNNWSKTVTAREGEAEKLAGDCCLYVRKFGKNLVFKATEIYNSTRNVLLKNEESLEKHLAAVKATGQEVPMMYIRGEGMNDARLDLNVDMAPPTGMNLEEIGTTGPSSSERLEESFPRIRSVGEEIATLGKAPERVQRAMMKRQAADEQRRKKREEEEKKKREDDRGPT